MLLPWETKKIARVNTVILRPNVCHQLLYAVLVLSPVYFILANGGTHSILLYKSSVLELKKVEVASKINIEDRERRNS